jgi:1-acyl-sn-glycerol-3-phosphate acyltransferase
VPAAPLWLRAVRWLALLALLACSLPLASALPMLSGRAQAAVTRAWLLALLRACGVRLVVHGGLATGPGTLMAANHVSWLDIPAVLAITPVRVLAKTDVRGWPVVGMIAARAGTIFIDRRRLRRLPGTIADVAESLRAGRDVLVFPEGSTWCGRTSGRFYPALFQAAVNAGAATVPVSLRYRLPSGEHTTAAAFVGDDTLLASVHRVIAARSLVVEVELGPPVFASLPVGAGPTGAVAAVARRDLAARASAEVHGGPRPSDLTVELARADSLDELVPTAERECEHTALGSN